MPDRTQYDRRQFLGAAALSAGVALTGTRSAVAAPHTSFSAPLKQINAGSLNVGYIEAGPAKGPPVLLLHGWPYDIYSFVDVTPTLASAGYRVIGRYLRGYGSPRFLSADTPIFCQPAARAHDALDLLDALKIQKAIVAGFDWGARTADIVAALWLVRCFGLVFVCGFFFGCLVVG